MSTELWLWAVHGSVNLAMVVLAARDVQRLAPWRAVDWDGLDASARDVTRATAPEGDESSGEKRGGPEVWLSNLRHEISVSPTPAARIATLNEATSDIEAVLAASQPSPMRVRVCAASGLALGCWVLADSPWVAAGYVGSGVVGAMLTWHLGRMADSSVRGLRGRWNGLIRRLGRSFPQSETLGDRPLTMQCGADERG